MPQTYLKRNGEQALFQDTSKIYTDGTLRCKYNLWEFMNLFDGT